MIYKGLLIFFGLPLLGASPYAQKCEKVIGVPVPDVDCSSPGGTEVPVGKVTDGKCENPSHGLSGCNPGTRFIKYTDTFERNGKSETVTTFIMCRKTNEDHARALKGEGKEIYSDIGIIQYNESKHATCWFSKTEDGQAPTKLVNGRKVYPSPSNEDPPGFWGHEQPESKCLKCHQSGVWLRNPFAMGAPKEAGKGFERIGRKGAYAPGNGNEIPSNNDETSKRGSPCSVGIPDWNKIKGGSAPYQMKIAGPQYDKKFPPPPGANKIAGSATCTRCHYLGVGTKELGRMTCDTLLEQFKGSTEPLLSKGTSIERHYWMPPGADGIESAKDYQTHFSRALEAVTWCCELEHQKDKDYDSICGGKFTSGDDDEGPVLRALQTKGPCALCPDCEEKESMPHRPSGQAPRPKTPQTQTGH